MVPIAEQAPLGGHRRVEVTVRGNASIALSWRLLLHQPVRLVMSAAGIAFALLLMSLQLNFRNALLDSSTELIRQLDADMLVMDDEKDPFLSRDNMPVVRMFQAQSVRGIQAAHPIWMDLMFWRNLETGLERPIRVIAVDPGDPVFVDDELNVALARLAKPGTALVDRRSRSGYGSLSPGPAQVDRHPLEIIGTFSMGADFEVDGNMIVGYETLLDLQGVNRADPEAILLHVEPGLDLERMAQEIAGVVPGDVRVLTKERLLERDLEYWRSETPLSVILLVGVGLGFAVGVVICYQVLYTEVLDHLEEFATLKAMGYGDEFLRRVVVAEAWFLSVLGFVPASIVALLFQRMLGSMTGLAVHFSWFASGSVFILSIGMCTAAGILALAKIRSLDPAELM